MRCFPLMFAPVLVTTALLNLVAGSTDEPYVNFSSNNTTRVSTNDSYVNTSRDDVATRFSTDDSYVNASRGDVTRFSTDDSYVNTSREDVTRFSSDDAYVNTSTGDVTRLSNDDSYVKTSRDDVTRLHQAAGTCDNLRECQNGGTCIPRDGQHFCDCLRGTSGDLCEIVDECVKILDKCKDGSKCAFHVELEKAICDCADTNQKYDSMDGKCKKTCNEDAMCKNGGLCMHRGDYLFCQCKGGTTGTFCEIVDDKECKDKCGELPGVKCKYEEGKDAQCFCDTEEKRFVSKEKGCSEICNYDFQCRNGGTCVKTESGSFCKCPEGTKGDFCEEVPACKNLQCGEDAECEFSSRSNRVRCNCKDFKLTFDEKDKTCKDLCANYTCENGGTCYSKYGEPMCLCPIHFYGVRCQHEEIDPCRNYTCENDGKCLLAIVTHYPVCWCPSPFYGERCELGEKVTDSCLNSTLFCENGGKCVIGNITQVAVCWCPSPFYGERCELGGIDKITLLNSLIWVGCSAIILLVLVSGCLIVARCRKGGGS